MGLPVVEGVAPQLAPLREVVGGDPRHKGGPQVPVQQKQLRMGPHIRPIHGHIDGDIPDEAHPLLFGVTDEGPQLVIEEVLQVGPEVHLPRQPAPPIRHRLGLAQPGAVLPLGPGGAAELALQRHKEGVVLHPPGILPPPGGHLLPIPGKPPGKRLSQHRKPLPVEQAVVHLGGVGPPVQPLVVLRLQQALHLQQVQVDQIGVAGKGGEALVGAIPKAGGAQGQYLPVPLARLGEKVHKAERLPAQGTDPMGGGQGGDVQQNPAGSQRKNTSDSRKNS